MKKFILKHARLTLIVGVVLAVSSVILYATSTGITGRTLKTNQNGCGGCHGPNSDPQVVVTITAPDSVTIGQTVICSLTVTKQSKTGAGLDIATRTGTLAPISSNIHLANGEITQNNNLPLISGSVTVQFSYTAPNTATTDTIWATGIATNSNSNTSGDDWNWAPSKRIIVKNPQGIEKISSEVPDRFYLSQNYPNPFNPSTKITFTIPNISNVRLSVFDVNGRTVEVAVDRELTAGTYEYDFSAGKFSSGIYFYTLETKDYFSTKKMLMIK